MTAVITDETAGCTPDLQPLWHHKAPRVLVETCPAEDFVRGWKTWQNYLRKRRKPAAPPFLAKKKSPLLWGWPQEWERTEVKESIKSPTTLAEIVIGDDPAASPDLPLALQTVALAYAMPKLARELPAEAWWQLLERLREIACNSRAKHVDWPGDPNAILRQQLLAGELPLALSYLFPEVRAMRCVARRYERTAFGSNLCAHRRPRSARRALVTGARPAVWLLDACKLAGLANEIWSLDARSRFAISMASATCNSLGGQRRPIRFDNARCARYERQVSEVQSLGQKPVFNGDSTCRRSRRCCGGRSCPATWHSVQTSQAGPRQTATPFAQFRLVGHHDHGQRLVAVRHTARHRLHCRTDDHRVIRGGRKTNGRPVGLRNSL